MSTETIMSTETKSLLSTPPANLLLRPKGYKGHWPGEANTPQPKWSAAYLPKVGEQFFTEVTYFPPLKDQPVTVTVPVGTRVTVVGYAIEGATADDGGWLYAVCEGTVMVGKSFRPKEPTPFRTYVAGIDVRAWRDEATKQLELADLLPDRTYELMYDVENAELDLRAKWSVRQARWSKGDCWRCTRLDDERGSMVSLNAVFVKASRANSGSVYLRSHESGAQLVAALRLLPETTRDVFERIGLSPEYHTGVFIGVMANLMKAGKFNEADIKEALDTYNKENP